MMEKVNEVLNKYGMRSKKPFNKKLKMDIERALLLYKVTDLNKQEVVQTEAQRNRNIENWLLSRVINRVEGLYIVNECMYIPQYQIITEEDKAAFKLILESLRLWYDRDKEILFFSPMINIKLVNELSNARNKCVPLLGQIVPSLELRAAFTKEERVEFLFNEVLIMYLLGILKTSGFLNELKESIKNTFVHK